MIAATPPVAMKYCYEIDSSKTSPEQINSLWQAEHPADPLRSAFHVITKREEDFLFLGEMDGPELWETCAGFGCSRVNTDNEALDRALLRFFIEHNGLFSILRYLRADQRASGPEVADLLLPPVRDDPGRAEV